MAQSLPDSSEMRSRYSADRFTPYVRDVLAKLSESDAEFIRSLPIAAVNAEKNQPGLSLAQTVERCLLAYADRPALGWRAFSIEENASSGQRERVLQPSFATLSYGELWSRVQHLAAYWQYEPERNACAYERICVLDFSGVGFTTVDLAAIHNASIVVPLQVNAPADQLQAIYDEVAPCWLVSHIDHLDLATQMFLQGSAARGLLVTGSHPEVDVEREALARAQTLLADAGLEDCLITLEEACARGAAHPAPVLHSDPAAEDRTATIYYTSGSTGSPKGVMYSETVCRAYWQMEPVFPFIYLHYMPMNHGFGRSGLYWTLSAGGTLYFTARSDLSLIFEDLQLVRPTFMGIVPRVCEMLYQRYQIEANRASVTGDDFDQALIDQMRCDVLGGRLLGASGGSAPLAPDLRKFIHSVLGFPLDDMYGATEVTAICRNGVVMKPPVVDYKLIDAPELGYYTTDQPYPRGELLVKTRNIMLGYYGRPELTAEVLDSEGYYRTGDIMAEVSADHLQYVDRRNNVLKLSQGEFVAISRLESLFTNGHPLIYQAFLYGQSDRAYLLAVLVPDQEQLDLLNIAHDDEAVRDALQGAVHAVARSESLQSYEIPRDFVIEREPFSLENELLAGIGKYRRPKLIERYGDTLNALYEKINQSQNEALVRLQQQGADGDITDTVVAVVAATLGVDKAAVNPDASFYDVGGDSLSALSVSVLLEEIFLIAVPVSLIAHPASSLNRLAQEIEERRCRANEVPTVQQVHATPDTLIHADELLLTRFITPEILDAALRLPKAAGVIKTVLLTGANGFLGRFLCLEWLRRVSETGGRVICLLRGRDAQDAFDRLYTAMDSGDKTLLDEFSTLAAEHLEVLVGDLGAPNLGLSALEWQRLSSELDVIVHPGAFVNHRMPYSQLFGPNVVGTAELIRLAISERIKPIHNVSTLGVAMRSDAPMLSEDDDVTVVGGARAVNADAYANGYVLSKWAAEVLLWRAAHELGLPVATFRCDMMLAHRHYRGQINQPDVFTRWVFSTVLTRLAPASYYQPESSVRPHYDGLPVDFSAAAIAEIGSYHRDGYQTYHAINPHDDGISLDQFADWISEAGYGLERVVDYSDWYQRFEMALRALPESVRAQSSYPLLHQMSHPSQADAGTAASAKRFSAEVARLQIGESGEIPELSREFILKVLADLKHLGMVH